MSADLKKQLADAIDAYHKEIENVGSFETKLREARKAEADALTDDSGDEKKIVKAVAESQGLQAVYSRRLELAREKVPQAFAAIPPIAKALAQDQANRCYALAAERAAAHRKVFRPRLDLATFHQRFSNSLHSFPVDFESELDQLIDCCPDVVNARACLPRLGYLEARHLPPDLTLKQLQHDLDSLEQAERAYEAEAAATYDFTPAHDQEENQEFAEQTA